MAQEQRSPHKAGNGTSWQAGASQVYRNPGIHALLARLENVRRNGDGWRANCPTGHKNARGSLALKETDSGAILMHCHCCGNATDPLHALGLSASDLFPQRLKPSTPEEQRAAREAFKRSSWTAALRVLAVESGLVLIAANDLRAAGVFAGEDARRLALAVSRIESAREVLV